MNEYSALQAKLTEAGPRFLSRDAQHEKYQKERMDNFKLFFAGQKKPSHGTSFF